MTCLHSRLAFQAGNACVGNGIERESLAEVGQALKFTEGQHGFCNWRTSEHHDQ